MLPSITDQAARLVDLGLLAPDVPVDGPAGGLLVTATAPSVLAPLVRRDGLPGFVVADMTDVDEFGPSPAAPVPAPPYVATGLDRGDELSGRTPDEALPEILAAGRFPLTLTEGLHWLLQAPEVLERNRCFMTIGSRRRRADGTLDARTPALWISNGTGRDGPERRGAPKVGWCWWGNRHTWLGMATCAGRELLSAGAGSAPRP